MSTDASPPHRPPEPHSPGIAFALAQLGSHATALFAQRMAELDLTPAQAGLLRMLAATPGRSQRELAEDLRMPPSRFVPFIDELDERGLIERLKNPNDRRLHAVHLTDAGGAMLEEIAKAAAAHERQLCVGLSSEERKQTLELLNHIVKLQGLKVGTHPGYRSM